MDKEYKKIYDIISTARVLCTTAAVFYVIYWFLVVIHFPFIKYIGIVFNPLSDLFRMAFDWTIEYNKVGIDMMPIVSAAFLQLMHVVLTPFLGMIERMDKQHRLSVIAEKKLEEKLMNENLKEIFTNKTLEYNQFAILLTLNLTTGVDINLYSKTPELEKLKADEYVKIVNTMRQKFATCKAITPNKLFIIYDNFALFDDFLSAIVSEVKTFSNLNAENGIQTEFLLGIDALKEGTKVVDTLDMLEKIMTFGYSNKAIATTPFNIRYKLNNAECKYILTSIGISRFFEKLPDGTQKGTDFELFSLKTAKH